MLNEKAKQCTSRTKSNGERCRNPAVEGYEVCKVHGAGTHAHPGGRPIEHGMYSERKEQMFGDRARELHEHPELILDLRQYIALLAAMLEDFLERLKDVGNVKQQDRDAILKMVDSITKAIEKLAKIDTDRRALKWGSQTAPQLPAEREGGLDHFLRENPEVSEEILDKWEAWLSLNR